MFSSIVTIEFDLESGIGVATRSTGSLISRQCSRKYGLKPVLSWTVELYAIITPGSFSSQSYWFSPTGSVRLRVEWGRPCFARLKNIAHINRYLGVQIFPLITMKLLWGSMTRNILVWQLVRNSCCRSFVKCEQFQLFCEVINHQ